MPGICAYLARVLCGSGSSPALVYARRPEVVVAISYGTNSTRLAKGTEKTIRKAIAIWRFIYNCRPLLLFANARHCGRAANESVLKRRVINRLAQSPDQLTRVVEIPEAIGNSIEEARAVQRDLERKGIHPSCVLVVANIAHGRSIRKIWGATFPGAEILIMETDFESGYDSADPFIFQRSATLWLLENLVRQTMLWALGVERTARYYNNPSARPGERTTT